MKKSRRHHIRIKLPSLPYYTRGYVYKRVITYSRLWSYLGIPRKFPGMDVYLV